MKGSITHDYLGLSVSGTVHDKPTILDTGFHDEWGKRHSIVICAGNIRAAGTGRSSHDICLLELCCLVATHSALTSAWTFASDESSPTLHSLASIDRI